MEKDLIIQRLRRKIKKRIRIRNLKKKARGKRKNESTQKIKGRKLYEIEN